MKTSEVIYAIHRLMMPITRTYNTAPFLMIRARMGRLGEILNLSVVSGPQPKAMGS
jgi:hypothetical protein